MTAPQVSLSYSKTLPSPLICTDTFLEPATPFQVESFAMCRKAELIVSLLDIVALSLVAKQSDNGSMANRIAE